eukprot:409497-Lingulodinium_polyedra.AAC.1
MRLASQKEHLAGLLRRQQTESGASLCSDPARLILMENAISAAGPLLVQAATSLAGVAGKAELAEQLMQ